MHPLPTCWAATVRWTGQGDSEWTAELRISPATLVAGTAESTLAIPLCRLQLDRLRDGRLLLSDPEHDDWVILTREPSLLDHPGLRRLPHLHRQIQRLESSASSRRALRSSVAFLIVFAAALGALALLAPHVVRLVTARIPHTTELDLGTRLTDRVTRHFPVLDDRILGQRLAAITNRLADAMRQASPHCSITLIDNPEVNAIALPGGQILVCRGLVEQVADGEELAGVIAHELAHVRNRHGLQSVVASAGPLLLVRLAFGQGRSQIGTMVEHSQELLALQFSRDQEHEADTAAFHMLVDARIDPRGLLRFMRRIETEETLAAATAPHASAPSQASRIQRVSQSHPLTPDRIRHLESLWNALPPGTPWTPVPWPPTPTPRRR
ncbi:MAG: M48 family metallopeptidase [Verrucomicrobiae bacterium]|nr:M48 family metallopeptidase [Verrucomicrobiae bacterium]